MNTMLKSSTEWQDVCDLSDIPLQGGCCALIEQQQIALFKVQHEQGEIIYAISNWDPIGKANVLYRGIVGSLGDDLVVASPLYKQHFSLITGRCLEQDDASVSVYPTRIVGNRVCLCLT